VTQTVWATPAAAQDIQNPTTWQLIPGAGFQAAASMTFTKQQANTRLVIAFAATAVLWSGVDQGVFFGLRIGGADFTMARLYCATGARGLTVGHRDVPAAAGALTIVPVMLGGSVVWRFWPGDDYITYSVTETAV